MISFSTIFAIFFSFNLYYKDYYVCDIKNLLLYIFTGLRQIGSLKCAVFCCILTLFVVTAVIMSAVILSRGSNEPRFPEIPDSGLDGTMRQKSYLN